MTRKTFNLQEDMISKEVRNHNLAAVVTSSVTNKGRVISDTEMRKASDPVKIKQEKKMKLDRVVCTLLFIPVTWETKVGKLLESWFTAT